MQFCYSAACRAQQGQDGWLLTPSSGSPALSPLLDTTMDRRLTGGACKGYQDQSQGKMGLAQLLVLTLPLEI